MKNEVRERKFHTKWQCSTRRYPLGYPFTMKNSPQWIFYCTWLLKNKYTHWRKRVILRLKIVPFPLRFPTGTGWAYYNHVMGTPTPPLCLNLLQIHSLGKELIGHDSLCIAYSPCPPNLWTAFLFSIWFGKSILVSGSHLFSRWLFGFCSSSSSVHCLGILPT